LSSNSDFNIITECKFLNASSDGVYISQSTENELTRCEFIGNENGLTITYKGGNKIYLNNFIDNGNHSYDNCGNTWDNGKLGNYWDDYQGDDENEDGIGDIAYDIPGGNSTDRYPLIYKVEEPRILATYPTDGATDIELDTMLLINFSRPMDPATSASVKLEPLVAELSYEWTNGRKSLIIKPSLLASYTNYIVNITQNAKDLYGFALSEPYSFSFRTKDITPPVIVLDEDFEIPEDENVELNASRCWDNAGIINWTWSFIEQEKEIFLYGEIVYYTFTQPGYYTITLNVSDEAGNWAVDFINLVVLDITPPVVTIISPEESLATSQNISLIYLVSDNFDSSEALTVIGPSNGSKYTEEGAYKINITCIDTAGNEVTKIINFTLDRTPPSLTILSPLDFVITSQTVTLSYIVKDNLASLEEITSNIKNGTSYTKEGNYSINLKVWDRAGNLVERLIEFVIEKTPPTTLDNAPLGWQREKPITITLAANDTLSGVNKTYYKLWLAGDVEPLSWTEGNIITITQDGKWKIKYYSTDNVGNEEIPTIIEVWLDATPPIAIITEESQRVTEKSFTLHWTTNAIDVQYYEVSMDSIEWTNVDLATSYEFTLVKGENTLYVRAVDVAGNIGPSSFIVVTYKKPEPQPWFIPGYETIYLLVIIGICVILARRKLKVGG
jgi:parallel beta-helix repeat protein